jgi:hypothetical protein
MDVLKQTLEKDEEFTKITNERDVKSYIVRTRRWCLQTLWSELRDEIQRTLTTNVLEQRKEEILREASAFAQRIMTIVKNGRVDTAEHPDSVNDIASRNGIDLEKDFPEQDYPTNPEDDVEERNHAHGRELVASVDEDSLDDNDRDSTNITYKDVAVAFMDVLYTNSLSTYKPNEKLRCPLCAEDPTISQEQKDKERTISHHKEHLKARMHSSYEQFRRQMEAEREELEEGTRMSARYRCPFCAEAQPRDSEEEAQSWKRFDHLAQHIDKSDGEYIHGIGAWKLVDEAIELHEELKSASGWYEEDFRGDEAWHARRNAQAIKAKVRRHSSFRWSKEIEISNGVPVEERAGLVRGGPGLSTGDMITAFPGLANAEDSDGPSTDELLARYGAQFTEADPSWSTADIMQQHTGLLKYSP